MADTLEQTTESVTNNSEILPRRTKILYSFGSVSEVLMGNLIGGLALPIFNVGFGVRVEWIGLALMIPRIWDAFTDPIIANISDNFHSRFGRRRPFILIGAILSAILFVLLWTPSLQLGETGLFVYFLVFSLLYFTAYTVFTIPYHALGAELTSDYNERIHLMSYKSFLMGVGGALFLNWAYKLCLVFGENAPEGVKPEIQGIKIVGIFYGVLFVIFSLGPVFFSKERFANFNREKISIIKAFKYTTKNKPFIITCMIIIFAVLGGLLVAPLGYYINLGYVFKGDKGGVGTIIGLYGTFYGIVSMLSVPLINYSCTRWGKKETLIVGLSLPLIAALLSWFLFSPEMPYLQLLHALIAAPGMSALWLLASVFVADVCDSDELKTGLRREGMYTGALSWVMKMTYAFTPAVAAYIVKWTAFVPDIVQTEQTIFRLRFLFMVVPVVFLLAAIYFTSLYPLNQKRMKQIQAQLIENRKNRQ